MEKLRKVASHPALLQVDRFETGSKAEKFKAFAKVALTPDIVKELPGGTMWKSDGIMDDHVKLSGKMKSLDYLLRRYLRKQNRVLIFSYSTKCLDVIQNHVKTQGWTNIRLDGQVRARRLRSAHCDVHVGSNPSLSRFHPSARCRRRLRSDRRW